MIFEGDTDPTPPEGMVNVGRFESPLEAQMAKNLRHDFAPRACGHGLLYEISRYINKQPIPPEHMHSLWLPNEMRLMRQHD